mmetsp:Transcript_38078/g.68017  ORF Transcript_38078/g.68017 Transcript_38078/m.68017 type:complete len:238 (-) Transcript_38078:419-1132(-)
MPLLEREVNEFRGLDGRGAGGRDYVVQEVPDPFECSERLRGGLTVLHRSREREGEHGEDVHHVLSNHQADIHCGLTEPVGQDEDLVQEHFAFAHFDVNGWEPCQVSVHRGQLGVVHVLPTGVCTGEVRREPRVQEIVAGVAGPAVTIRVLQLHPRTQEHCTPWQRPPRLLQCNHEGQAEPPPCTIPGDHDAVRGHPLQKPLVGSGRVLEGCREGVFGGAPVVHGQDGGLGVLHQQAE